jgi:carboxyl-terminal processing protease
VPAAPRLALAVLALLLGGAVAFAAPAKRFLPTEGRPGLARVEERGKLAVRRAGGALRIKAYVPATRDGVAGVEVHEVVRPARAPSDPAEADAFARSFATALDRAVDLRWRRDLGVAHMYRGALRAIAAGRLLDEVGAFERALRGLAGSLRSESGATRDLWTTYVDARTLAEQHGPRGVGLRLAVGERDVVVRHIRPDSAAARVGLRRGDRLRTIAGRRVDPRRVEQQLRARDDRPFDLGIERGGVHRVVRIRREELFAWPLRAARTREGMAVLRFNDGFPPGMTAEIQQALVRLGERGPLRGIVLDLRGNPGGHVAEGEALLDELVERGTLYTTEDGAGRRAETSARGGATYGTLPIAVLVDRDTRSLGEIVAVALRGAARGRVVVVGEPSYGKGLVQDTHLLPRGALVLTTGLVRNAAGRTPQATGVIPDIDKATASARQAARHPGRRVVDPVLREALDQLVRLADAGDD